MAGRSIRLTLPTAGKDKLIFHEMVVVDQLSEPFEITLRMIAKRDTPITLKDMLGKHITVEVDVLGEKIRYFDGIVAHILRIGQNEEDDHYQAILRPWFWLLTHNVDYRVFQNKSSKEIIKKVFEDRGFSADVDDSKLKGTYRTREYCVQYRESDFAFVSRLMEEDGIYYFFEHKDGQHKLILADANSAHKVFEGYGDIGFHEKEEQAGSEREYIWEWDPFEDVLPGKTAVTDYNFDKANTPLLKKAETLHGHDSDKYEVFEYPGRYLEAADGEPVAKLRMEEYSARFAIVDGKGNARGIAVGSLVNLKEAPLDEDNREYLFVAANHFVGLEAGEEDADKVFMETHFQAMSTEKTFRPRRKTVKPVIPGIQTAKVTGPSGEEIHTDKYGRVRIHFVWDREGKEDETSSCFVRVAQVWAGKNWGGMYIPRVGMEVIVSFIDGDPDRPLIVGTVYNSENMPPYELPTNATKGGIKTDSSKGGGGSNEIRFEDKKDSEEIYIHAQKDMKFVIKNDHEETVEEGNRKITVSKGNNTFELSKGDDTYSVLTGKRETKIKADDTLTIESGNLSIKISAGKSEQEAAQSIELKVGGSSIKIEPAQITIKSTNVTIEASGAFKASGATSEVSGSGTLTLKGGMVNIN